MACIIARYRSTGRSKPEPLNVTSCGPFPDVGCAEGVDLPMAAVAVGDQSTDANNGMVNVLGEFISQCLANLMVGLAVVSIGGGKASEIWDRFNVPNDEMVRHLSSSKLMVS